VGSRAYHLDYSHGGREHIPSTSSPTANGERRRSTHSSSLLWPGQSVITTLRRRTSRGDSMAGRAVKKKSSRRCILPIGKRGSSRPSLKNWAKKAVDNYLRDLRSFTRVKTVLKTALREEVERSQKRNPTGEVNESRLKQGSRKDIL